MSKLLQRLSQSYDLAVDGWYNEAAAYIVPEPIFVSIFNWKFAKNSRLHHASDGWWINATNSELSIALPKALTAVRFSQKSVTAQLDTVCKKYQLTGFVELEEGDTVVDIGAFIGEFAMSAAGQADSVLAFEPDPINHAALVRTTEQYDNIVVRDDVLWCKQKQLSFSVATDGSESSIFQPDRGKSSHQEQKAAIRFDSLASTTFNFVKVEAEGAEAEIIDGFGNAEIEKIAVDCSETGPGGKTPEHKIKRLLDERGYETRIINKESYGTMLFARNPSE